ncbi:MAG: hypothetical protein H0X02_01590 [Nitrosomonas sp.]|nr:hypothetical protein [Nitrosomonas sp.]
MAGTLVVTRDPRQAPNQGKCIERIVIDWTSDASGNADVSIANLYGFVLKVVTVPSATAPTALYDITLVDENLVDALDGKLADRSATVKEQVYPFATGAPTPIFLCGTHTFTVAAAGNAKIGKAILYIVESL